MLGVVVKAPSPIKKQYIVLVLKPDLPSSIQTPSGSSNLQDSRGADFQQGVMLLPKARRGLEDEYFSSVTSRKGPKGSGVINIKLPHLGSAAGVVYEVKECDSKEFQCICSSRIKIDYVRLLEDVSSAAFSSTVQQLLKLKSDGNGNKYPPALDPRKGTSIPS